MKILVALKVCHKYVQVRTWSRDVEEKHRTIPVNDQIAACRETWVRDLAAYPNVDVRFFYGRGATRQPLPDEVFLDCADDYNSLPYKTKAICAWAFEHGYDFIFLTDDDTYVWVDRLMKSGFESHDYLGAVSYLSRCPYATGLGYWMSAKAARCVAVADPRGRTMEDHWVGEVMQANKIGHKYDERYRSIGAKFVGVDKMPRNMENIAIHPCNSEMMRAYASESAACKLRSKTALVVIATGDVYRQYSRDLVASAKRFFVPHDVVLFTDNPSEFAVPIKIKREPLGYPRATLTRYHAIYDARETLSKYDHIFYSDADMLFVAPVTEEEIFSEGITATEHPGYVGMCGTPERNPRSTAYLASTRTYFCGGFNGGTSGAFLQMAETIKNAVDADDANGILAIWHDESHLNRYLYDHPPARILTPAFCYPQSEYEAREGGHYAFMWRQAGRQGIVPKLVALDKESRRSQ